MSLEPGAHFGRYEIVGLLGKGGMGEVYRARDSRLGRDVAVKIISGALVADAHSVHRFEREARALAALAHPNVVPIFDFGAEGNLQYVVTELVEGETLRQRLAAGALSAPEVGEIGAQVADGLAAAHAKGLVHRDIKPENIVLADGRARILDFGVARRMDSAAARAADDSGTVSLTDLRAIVGTPGYMSPEQIRAEPLDARSDLFALGAVLLEMLTGRRAFGGASPVETIEAVLHVQPDVGAREVPPSLSPVLQRCLAKKREDRYGSALELARDLRGAVFWDATERRSVPRSGHRNRWRWAVSALVVGVVLALLGALALRRSGGSTPMTSIAVLPFRTLGSEAATHLGLGLADAIIGRLATFQQLTVRPTSAVRRFEVVDSDAIQVGRQLGVDAVVEGTLRQMEGGTRVVMHLTDVRRGAVVWSDQLDLPKGRLFELEETIATRLVDRLQVKLDAFGRSGRDRSTPVSDRVLQRYFAASSQLSDAGQDPERARELFAEFDALVDDQPDFARALAARAYAGAWRNYFAPELGGPERVLRDAAKALQLDPELALPHVARAALSFSSPGGWRFVDAVRELRVAMKVSPGSEAPHIEMARVLYHWGWLSEARHEVAEIHRLDPMSAYGARANAVITWFEGRPREALPFFGQRASGHGRQTIEGHWQEVAIRLQTGEAPVSPSEIEAWARELPDPLVLALLTIARVRSGDRRISELEERVLATDQGVGHFHHVLHALAEARAQLGDVFVAVGYLRRASETGFPCLPCFDNDPLLAPVHGSPEYTALRAEVLRTGEAARKALSAH